MNRQVIGRIGKAGGICISLLLPGILVVALAFPGFASPAPDPAPIPSPAPPPTGPITVAVSPSNNGLTVSQSLTLTATVLNDSTNSGVTWSVSGSSCSGSACGTLSAITSTTVKYTAPTTAGVYFVTAASVANITITSTATIGVTALNGVFTYRNDLTRSSVNSQEYALTPSNVNTTSFGKIFSCTLDGSIYAQPLWVANVAIGGGTHNIVIVATQNDSVYALDADSTSCTQYWVASMLLPAHGAASGATPVPSSDVNETQDIPTQIGITSTPVIDPTTNLLYVVSKTKENGSYFQRLHRLNLLTGAEMTGSPVTLAASVSGIGDGSSGGTLSYIPLRQNPRPGLALVNGSIYISSGSHGDNSPWHGWILKYDATTLAQTGVFCTTPNTGGGGIWMSGSAPIADSSNNIYVISSNGTYNGTTEFGDTFLKLTTTSGLTLNNVTTDSFTPDDQSTLSTNNIDLGAGGAITLLDSVSGPVPHLLIGGGKEGILYLLNRDSMGGYNASNNSKAVQTWQLTPGQGTYGGISSSGEFWQNTFYIAGAQTPLEAFAFDTTKGLFNPIPSSQSATTFGFPGLTPAISASGTTNAIVWAVDTSGNGTNGAPTGSAVLYAYDATNLAHELWDSTQAANNRDQAALAIKFAVPTVANGKVYVSAKGVLNVYGLLNLGPAAAAPTFSPAPGSYPSSQSVSLSDTTTGATIYYTLDGSTPTTSSSVYVNPINVSTTTTINAMAVASGLNNSTVSTGSYTIQGTGNGTISFIQGTSATPQSAATTVAITFAGAQTAGDLNVIVVGWNDTTHTVSSVVDSKNNVYNIAAGPTANAAGGLSQTIYYAKNIVASSAGGNTVTVTFSGATTFPDIRILEYSGADLSAPLDIAAVATGSSASSTVTSSTATTNANDLLFAANIIQTVTTGAGTSFTSRMITVPDGDIAEDRLVAATGTYTAAATLNAPGQWIMQMVAFKASSGSGGDTTPPTAPSSLGATAASASQINLSWTASTDNVGVTGYMVERCQGAGCTSFVQIATPTTTAYTDTGLLGSTSYSYRVRATDAAGNLSGYSNAATTTTLADTTPPTAPSNLTTTPASSSQINLSWTASTDNVGVTNYLVERCQGASCSNFAQVSAPRVTNVDDTGLTASTSYSYRVRAQDLAGNLSAYSNISTTTTPSSDSTPPTAPSNLTSTAISSSQINLSWTASTDNVGVTGYMVERCLGSGCTTFAQIATPATTTFSDTGLTASTSYSYRVRATDAAGNLSGYSNVASATTQAIVTANIAFVQGASATPQSSPTTVPVTFAAAQVAGDLNVVIVGWSDATHLPSAVTDSKGNSYVLAVGPTVNSAGGVSQSIYYAKNIAASTAGSNVVTVTFNGATAFPDVRILEYSGVTTLDVTAGTSGSSATSNSGAATTTSANELIVGANTVATVTTAAGSGFTSRMITVPDADIAEDKIVTTTGSNSATATLSSGAWVMQMATFSAGGSAPAPTVASVSPNNGPAAGGTGVTISGANFVSGATVTFGGTAATGVVVSNSTTITATTPAHASGAVTVVVTNPDTQIGSLASGFAYAAAPSVSSVSPNNGPAAGGTGVTISGTNFVSGATVTFGGTAATSVVVSNSTTITATTPAHAAGAVTVVVKNPDTQTGSLASGFTYTSAPPPAVSSVSPASGPAAGGTGVTISGTNFVSGATVTFGGTAATGVVVSNSTTITATTPAHTTGPVTVVVTNPDTQVGSLASAYLFVAAPTVSSVSPNNGPAAGGTGVTVSGANFVIGATVTFGGTSATSVVVTNSTTITATTPAHAAGAVTVVVTNPDTQIGSLASAFTYTSAPPPSVSSVSPASGPAAGGTGVTISGANFVSGATVTFGGTAATGVVVTNSTTITATTPAHASGAVAVVVTNPDTQIGSLASAYVFVAAPTLSSVSPAGGPAAGGTGVTITGANFVSGATVTFGGTAATGVVVTNSTTITATTPAHAAGAVTVTVTNPDTQVGSLASGFAYAAAPGVSSVSPNNGPAAGGTGVAITGTNFVSGATVTFGGTAATGVVVTNSTTITATTPAHAAGAVTVTVTNPDTQVGSLASGFAYAAAPGVSSVSPNNGPAAGGTGVTITGTNFVSGATVTFGGTAATSVVVSNSTTITATTPAHAAGAVTVTVTNPDTQVGSLTSAYTFVAAPTVTSVSPNSGTQVGGTGVTISGGNFVAGATVTFGGTAATGVVVSNSTTITATTPAHAAGAVTVVVKNPDTQSASLSNGYTYTTSSAPAPTVSSVSPNNGLATGGTGVTITGANFVSGATVTFGGTAATSVVVSNSTTITATTPAHSAGAVSVVVKNPDAQTGTLTNGFTYNAIPISFVQSVSATPQSTTATVSIPYTLAQTLGDLNIVVVGWNDTTASVQSVKDSSGNVYNVAVGPTSGNGLSQTIYYAGNIAGGSNTVTVTFNQAAAFPDIRILEYKGVNTLDVAAGASGSSATANSGAATTTTANELVFGANMVATLTGGPGSGFTSRVITTPDGDIAEDKIVAATGSNSATASVSPSGAWVMQMATFLFSGAPPTDTTPPSAPTNLTGSAPAVQNVQGYINSNAQTIHTTAAFDSTGGDVIVICASSHAGVTMTPSDSFNNTWTSISGPTNTSTGVDLRTQIWYAKSPTVGAGHTITMTLSALQSLVISVFVVKGSNISNPIDLVSTIGDDAGTQSLNVASPSITTTSANDLLIGFAKSSGGVTFTSGSGFTAQPTASSNFLDAESGLAITPGSYDATFLVNFNVTWQAAVVAVRPSATSSTSSTITLSWSTSSDNVGVTGYLLERCQGATCSNFAQIATTANTTLTDTGLTPSTTYSYRVRATDAASNLSSYSNTVVVSTQP
jgi:DNA-binding protein YbaB